MDLLDTRETTHGDWDQTARIAQQIKRIIEQNGGGKLSMQQHEALDMIASKMARILSGDPGFEDHWRDIIGYAHLGCPGLQC